MYDVSVDLQLAGTGLRPSFFRPQAYPYLDGGGNVASIAYFEQAADFFGVSMLNWEPEYLAHYTTGTAAASSGNVTISGGSLPNYPGNVVYPLRFYANGQYYPVASRVDANHLTLVSPVSFAAGTEFKFASWDYREVDPHFAAAGEWQTAYDEFAHALSLVEARAYANNARVCLYDMGVHTVRRQDDILGDVTPGSYEEWQDEVETSANYQTSSGFSLRQWLKRHNSVVFWTNYVPAASLASSGAQDRYIERNRRIIETLAALDIPNMPLFRGYVSEENAMVPWSFQERMLAGTRQYQHGWWGIDGEYDAEYKANISRYIHSVNAPVAAVGSSTGRAVHGASFGATSFPMIFN